MPIPMKLREAVLQARDQGCSYKETAELLGIGYATVNRILRLHRETKSLEPRPRGGGNRTANTVVTPNAASEMVPPVGGPMAHRKWSEIEARGVLEAWKQSGVSLEEFARQRGLVTQRLRFAKDERALATRPCRRNFFPSGA